MTKIERFRPRPADDKSRAGTPLDPDQFYGADDFARRWGVHRGTVWRWVRLGIFPPPVKFGPPNSRGRRLCRWQGKTALEYEREAQSGTTAA
jgi:prophage regulatory protein